MSGPRLGRSNEDFRPLDVDDRLLMARIRQSEETAFDALLARYWSALVDYASGILDGVDDANDVVQEVFVRIWEQRRALHGSGSVRGLLYRMTRNRAVDELRKRRVRSRPILLFDEELRPPATPDEVFRHAELQANVEAALMALPPRRREIFLLAHRHRLTHREIAETLDISPQTVANQMSSALAELRRRLHAHAAQKRAQDSA